LSFPLNVIRYAKSSGDGEFAPESAKSAVVVNKT
jgi:hypothetical protein